MRPSFCVDRANRSVPRGRMVGKVAYVWGRFRLGLTLDYAVFVFMYLWMYVDALFWKGIERIEVFRITVKTTYQLSFNLHVHLYPPHS